MTFKIRRAQDIKSVPQKLWSQASYEGMLAYLDSHLDKLTEGSVQISWSSFPRYRNLAGHVSIYKTEILKELCNAGYIAREYYLSEQRHESSGFTIEKLI